MLPTEWHVQDEMSVRLFGPSTYSLNPNDLLQVQL